MIDLDAIRARDRDYDDVFEAQANMQPMNRLFWSKDIAHRLVAWPVHDRRALLAEVDRLREVFASGASTMAQATDEIERLRDWQRRAIDLLTLSYDPPCEEYHPECPGCQAHDLIGGAQS